MARTRKPASIASYDPATRSFSVVASTRAPIEGLEPAAPGQDPQPRLESLESWDLTRFLANPVVLRDHDSDSIDAIIGAASDVRETPRGLEMVITLASTTANPDADALAAKLAEGVLRGVSVGFEFGERTDEQRDGQTVAIFRNNVLNEVSLVTVPADPAALVTDAAERTPSWKDFGAVVFEARERWLESGSAEDRAHFDAVSADYAKRFECADPIKGVQRCGFDARKTTKTSCSCPAYGACACSFAP